MARLTPWLYAALCLVAAVAVLAALKGPPAPSTALAPERAQQAAVLADQAPPPSTVDFSEPQTQTTEQLPASSISLSKEQSQAAAEMKIAPLPKESQTTSAPQAETPIAQSAASEQASGPCQWTKTFLTTAYGPPWDAIEGGPITSSGKALVPNRYYVATDPSVIPTGSQMKIWPNPLGYKGLFTAEDVGGAIKGKHIDVFVWQGRSVRDSWKKNAKVCLTRKGR